MIEKLLAAGASVVDAQGRLLAWGTILGEHDEDDECFYSLSPTLMAVLAIWTPPMIIGSLSSDSQPS